MMLPLGNLTEPQRGALPISFSASQVAALQNAVAYVEALKEEEKMKKETSWTLGWWYYVAFGISAWIYLTYLLIDRYCRTKRAAKKDGDADADADADLIFDSESGTGTGSGESIEMPTVPQSAVTPQGTIRGRKPSSSSSRNARCTVQELEGLDIDGGSNSTAGWQDQQLFSLHVSPTPVHFKEAVGGGEEEEREDKKNDGEGWKRTAKM